jgi:O-antigen/teichoic acid export membrane protein
MINISKKDIIWNYAGNILNMGMSLIILPFVLKMLNSQEIGLWYVFSSVASLVMLVDFGFSPTIMRSMTYAWSGALALTAEGTPEFDPEGKTNNLLVGKLTSASKMIYLIMSMIIIVVLLSAGTLYVRGLINDPRYIIAWLLYSFAVFANLFYSNWTSILKGIGAIEDANKALVISRIIYVVFSVIGLVMGGGLIWLSAMFLLSGLLLGIMSKNMFMARLSRSECQSDIEPFKKNNFIAIFHTLWPNAKKQGIVTIGSWLISRSSTLICSSFLGLEITAQYGLSLQILGFVGSFSQILFNSYLPEITSAKVSLDARRFKVVFSRAIVLQWLIGILGITFSIIAGPIALRLIGSNSTLLPTSMMIPLGLILFLEWNHSTFATLITLSNTVPFVKASIISGSIIVLLSFLSVNYWEFGVLGLILSQGIIQLAYNNWRWPYWIFHENKWTIQDLVKSLIADLRLV